MQKYATYKFEDFINDDAFICWVKYPDAVNIAFWQNVVGTYPHLQLEMERAKQAVTLLVSDDLYKSRTNEDNIKNLSVDIWKNIENNLEKENALKIRNPKFSILNPVLWAASIALLVAVGSWWYSNHQTLQNIPYKIVANENAIETKTNLQDNPLTIILPDSSTVVLEKNSFVEFPKNFADSIRSIHLTGEALFDVVKNKNKPFIVYTDKLATKVLGTSFRIKAFTQEPEVTVSVLRGRVSVFNTNKTSGKVKDPETTGLILVPNQKATFQKKDEKLSRTLTEKPVILVPKEALARFVFDEAPVSQIFRAIEKIYNVEIVFDEEAFKNCILTTRLNDETLFEKLTVLCKSIGANYKVVDAQIVIEGKGCN